MVNDQWLTMLANDLAGISRIVFPITKIGFELRRVNGFLWGVLFGFCSDTAILPCQHTLTFLPVSIDGNSCLTHLLDDTITKLVGISVIQQPDITNKIISVIITDETHHHATVTINLLAIIQSGNLYGILRHDAIAVGIAYIPIIALMGDGIFLYRAVLVDRTDRQSVT